MSDATTELSLQLAVGTDDTADYLVSKLRQSLVTIDGLYNATSGHTHSGPHQGGKISSGAFNGQMDIGDYFRSTATGHAPPTSGVGLEWWWDSANTRGLIQAYDHGANAQRPLWLVGSEVDLVIGGGNRAYTFQPTSTGIRFWNPDNSSGGSIRTRSGNGFELVNAAYTAVTFGVDDSGNVTIPGTLVAGATQLNGTLATGSTISAGGDIHFNNHNADGIGTLTFQSGANLHASTDHVQATNHLDISYDLLVGRNAQVNAALTVTNNIISSSGVIQSGAAIASMSAGDISANRGGGSGWLFLGDTNHRLEYNNNQNYVLRNAGLSTDWLATNTGGRSGSYGITLPNNSGQPGKILMFGYDTYSAAADKTDVTPLAEPLAIVTHPNLHGITYKHVDNPTGPDILGFVADEWLAVFPSLVSLNEDGSVLAMDYARVGAVTFQAVKQLAALVQELSDRLTALEGTRGP